MEYYESKYTGAEVDALLDKVNSGEVGGKVTVDSALSTESENPVMNKVITEELNKLKETVLKTTPQTLSDDAKNQALANLGIDPVVWKYMMNPITIINGESVPQDIIDIYPNTLPIICFSATTNGGEWSWGTPVWIDSYNGVAFNFTDEGYYIARIVNGLWSLEEY